MKKHYYQLVRQYGKFDIEYLLYEARKDNKNNIEISSLPFVIVGNSPEEIFDTIKQILRDVKANPVVDKNECNIYHDKLWHDDIEYFDESDEISELDEVVSRLFLESDNKDYD